MKLKGLVDEDFVQYKKPSMFIIAPYCTFKCDKEAGCNVCENSALTAAPIIEMDDIDIWHRYDSNPITEAIVFGGLEPFEPDWWADFGGFIMKMRSNKDKRFILLLLHQSFNLLRNICILHKTCKILCTRTVCEDRNDCSSMT